MLRNFPFLHFWSSYFLSLILLITLQFFKCILDILYLQIYFTISYENMSIQTIVQFFKEDGYLQSPYKNFLHCSYILLFLSLIHISPAVSQMERFGTSFRVAEIQWLTAKGTWHHVSSHDNTTDILSCGCLPRFLHCHQMCIRDRFLTYIILYTLKMSNICLLYTSRCV